MCTGITYKPRAFATGEDRICQFVGPAKFEQNHEMSAVQM
jgi:hypothetical protein